MKCFNWKVVAGLAALAFGIWILVPGLAAAALPLLVLAACPLSMLVMMLAMRSRGDKEPPPKSSEELTELRAEVAALRAGRERT